MEEIKAFKTLDGEVFSDEAEASSYEAMLKNQDTIEEFLNSSTDFEGKGQRTRAKNIISKFLEYTNEGENK